MTTPKRKNPHAVSLGRLGGLAKKTMTPAALAARKLGFNNGLAFVNAQRKADKLARKSLTA